MPRRILVLLALLLPTFVRAAETASVPWHGAPNAAVAVARAQQKMLLVYYRGDCGRCSAASDAMFENAASDEIFVKALDSFLPLRVDATTAAHPIVDALRTEKKVPVVAIYDADDPCAVEWVKNAEAVSGELWQTLAVRRKGVGR